MLGLMVHLYKFTNLLPNADALYNFYSNQNMTASGRWFLAIACGFSSWFDLPWVNGILSLIFMGLTAAMVAEVFRMENPVLIVLSSGLLVSFPAMTATMAYEFTADGYMLAMALAGLSVCLSRMEYMVKKHWPRLVLSGVCICLACGIYQAYVSFAFVLAVCYFMTELLENRRKDREYRNWILIQVLIYGCAMAGYYLIWKLCLTFQGFTASSYQGIDRVGAMGAGDLARAVLKIAKDFIRFFTEWNILDHGITVYSALNILFLVAFAAALVVSLVKSQMRRRKIHLLLFALCLVALPVGCYLWYLTSPDVVYHALMLQSMCLLYILTAVLFDRWICPRGSNAVLLLLVAIVFNNSVTANMYYNYMHQSFEKTRAVAVELNTRIHLLDEGQIRYVAIYGSLGDWDQEAHFNHGELRQLGGWKVINRTILSPMFLSLYTDFNLSYYRTNGLEYPVVENDPDIPAPQDWEFRFPLLEKKSREALALTPQVQAMPIWPARDSVQVIGDTVVVKLSEPQES
ncbi:MAG: glucosyltransferase domain-containing protein [Faecousia sp.]